MLQMKVYNDLGKGVLKNAWEGFNTSLFAYGQTGSGKSWSIVGYGANRGKLCKFFLDFTPGEGGTPLYGLYLPQRVWLVSHFGHK